MTQPKSPEEWKPRKNVLTEADLEKLAEVMQCTRCGSFTAEQTSTLVTLANSVNRTQKIASWVIITGTVSAFFAGVYAAIKYYVINVVLKGNH